LSHHGQTSSVIKYVQPESWIHRIALIDQWLQDDSSAQNNKAFLDSPPPRRIIHGRACESSIVPDALWNHEKTNWSLLASGLKSLAGRPRRGPPSTGVTIPAFIQNGVLSRPSESRNYDRHRSLEDDHVRSHAKTPRQVETCQLYTTCRLAFLYLNYLQAILAAPALC
jgi:hypothetical protein